MRRAFYIFLLFTGYMFGQEEGETEFYPLLLIDSISDNEAQAIRLTDRIDSLKGKNYFFTKKYKNEDGVFFIRQNGRKFSIYDFEPGPNTFVAQIELEDKRFISIRTVRYPSGQCSGIYGEVIILDFIDANYWKFSNFNSYDCYDEQGDITSHSECKATFSIKDDVIKIESTKKPDDDLFCIESAKYKIANRRLQKLTYHHESSEVSFPILCCADICTGIHISDLKKNIPKASFREIPMDSYNPESDKLGLEVSFNGEIHFVAVVSNDIVNGIWFISKAYNCNGVDTTNTISEILKKHPNDKLYIDLLSDWEYIYIKEKKLKVIFKTDNSNRIGIYKKDVEEGTRKITRNSKVDFIQVN